MESSDKKLYTPKYVKIQDYILNEIRDGRLKTGDQIPSEAEFSRMFKVSRITVTTALKELTTRGILSRIQGKGTFVKRDILVDTDDSEYPAAMSEERDTPFPSRSIAFGGGIRLTSPECAEQKPHTLLENRIIPADPVLCRKLGLEVRSYVYQIVRCIKNAVQTEEMDFTYIPLSVCGGHSFDCEALSTSLIHDYISRNFPEKPTNVDIYLQPELTGDIDISAISSDMGNAPDESLLFWDTVVRRGEKILAVTTTVSRLRQGMKFLTLEIPEAGE